MELKLKRVQTLIEDLISLTGEAATLNILPSALVSPKITHTTATPPPDALPFHLDQKYTDWETPHPIIRSVPDLIDYLAELAEDWAETLNMPAPKQAETLEWLADWAQRAFEERNPIIIDETSGQTLWDEDYETLEFAWENATRLAGLHPDPTGLSCPLDGTGTVRYPQDDGFTDLIFCPKCGTPWNPKTWNATIIQTITRAAKTNPNLLITSQDAPKFGIPTKTVYTWIRHGQIELLPGYSRQTVRLGDALKLYSKQDETEHK